MAEGGTGRGTDEAARVHGGWQKASTLTSDAGGWDQGAGEVRRAAPGAGVGLLGQEAGLGGSHRNGLASSGHGGGVTAVAAGVKEHGSNGGSGGSRASSCTALPPPLLAGVQGAAGLGGGGGGSGTSRLRALALADAEELELDDW